MKLTKRKGFNFFRSYYDVYNELSNKEKVEFMDALLDKQFLGKNPENLKGMAKFAYISQTNSIDSQVKGYEDKTGTKLSCAPTQGGSEPPTQGGNDPPTLQVQVQVQEQGKGKGKGQLVYPFDSENFKNIWNVLIKEKKWKGKSNNALQMSLKKLSNYQEGDAIKMIENTISGGYQGLFEIDNNKNKGNNGKQQTNTDAALEWGNDYLNKNQDGREG